jgi:hypothetical protein
VGVGKANGQSEGWRRWWMYFVTTYENRKMEIVLRRQRGRGMKENDGGGEG